MIFHDNSMQAPSGTLPLWGVLGCVSQVSPICHGRHEWPSPHALVGLPCHLDGRPVAGPAYGGSSHRRGVFTHIRRPSIAHQANLRGL